MQGVRYRTDIDGLRAIAVGVVVAFHMGVPLSQAGFIGVDVFFVLSGFLITGILAGEADELGTLRLGRFYTRRIRRLLPASTLTVLATMAASFALLSALSWRLIAETSTAAALYVSNIFFAQQSDNYFAADVQNNPLLHFWSLAVEEQFYIVWPLLILVLSRFSSRVRILGLGAVAVASLIHSIILTEAATPWAYYSPLSRAWEFAAGGLVALLLPLGIKHASALVREIVAWSGLALIGGSLLFITEQTPFPGVAAIPTVLGTCLVIVAVVAEKSPLGIILRSWPMQQIGALSYSWYLWHWPFLVIGQAYLNDTRPATRILLAAASLGVAAITHHLIENPVRFAKTLVRAERPNWIMAGAMIAVVLVASFGMVRSADNELAQPEFSDLVVAQDDVPRLAGKGCDVADIDYLLSECSGGSPDASKTIVVLGDSHAQMWTPTLEALADELDFHFTVHILGGCNVAGVQAQVTASYCTEVQARNVEIVDALDADAVLVSHISTNILDVPEQEWIDGIDEFLTAMDQRDVEVAWVHDGPGLSRDPIECVATKGEAACTEPVEELVRVSERLRRVETPTLVAHAAFAYVPIEVLCNDETCPLRSDGIFVFRDDDHVSATYATALAPQFRPFIAAVLNAGVR